MKKRIWSLVLCTVLCVVLAVGLLPGKAQAATPTQDSDGYYLIGNEDELFAFAALVNGGEYGANGKLTADITMTGSGRTWTPIGASSAYTGTFDGQGHTISGLYCNGEQYAGLFGRVNGGTVRNVTVADGTVTGISAGAIAGIVSNGTTIEGCGNLDTTVSGNSVGGGIAGDARSANIRACWNTGSITGHDAGGICGWAGSDTATTGCWNIGSAISTDSVSGAAGGIIGRASNNTVKVTYCYNDGVVNCDAYNSEGAIVGINNNTKNSHPEISNCYYTRPDGGAGYAYAYGDVSDNRFTNVARVSSSMLPTGEGAWFMNQGLAGTGYQFYQNLDNGSKDNYPVLSSSHGTVYKGYKVCSNTVSYSNSRLSESVYHEGIGYEKDGLTIKQVCTNESCSTTKGLGSVTLAVADAYYTGSPIGAVTGSLQNGATYKVTYNDAETAPSQVGSYTAKLTVYEGSDEKASVTANYEISYLPAPALSDFTVEGHSYEADGVYWFKDTSAVVTPPAGFAISKSRVENYDTEVFLAEGEKTVYLKQTSDGAMTDAIDLSGILKFDHAAPEGKITLSSSSWSALQNKAPFNVFFNEAMTVTVTAQDPDSGVKSVQYYVAEGDLIGDAALDSAAAVEKLETAIGTRWSDYNGEIPLALNGKHVVYAKVTDNVGNVSYVSSTGIVLYTDAVVSGEGFTVTYSEAGDVEIPVTFNGNTVKEIREDLFGVLTPDTHYTVDEDGITLKAAFLNSLPAGNHYPEVTFNPLGEAYVDAGSNQEPRSQQISLRVSTKPVTVPGDDTTRFVYNGTEQVYGIAESEFYTVTGNKQAAAGDYTVTVSLKDKNNTVWFDGTTEDKTYPFKIAKATFDMSGTKWNYTEPLQYAGKALTVELTGLPAGVTASYSGNSATVVGDYTAVATLAYDENNYNPITVPELNWSIENNWTPTQYTATVRNSGGWANEDFVITPAEGYQVSLTNTADGAWEDKLTYTAETEGGSVTFYLKNSQGHISLEKTETYKLDKTNPTGGIAVDERSWEGFFGAIFDKLTNKDMTVTITADDTLSGVAKVEYFESAQALDLAGVQAVTGWTEGRSVNVTKEDAKRFIYYARITDKAGNITYLASNGTEFDTSAPKFTGVVDGGVYAVTTVLTIEDKHLAQITVNGVDHTVNASTERLTIEGNRKATYEIVAVDDVGNQTTVRFETVTIASLGESIEGLTPENVTLDDMSDVEQLLQQLEDTGLTNATAEEKAAVKALEEKVQALEDRLEELEAAADTEAINKALDVTDQNVALEDAEDLQQAIEDMEKLLEDFEGNLTEEDTQSVEAALKQLQDALQVVESAKAVQKAIDALAEKAEPDDEAAIKAAAEAQKAYDALSAHGKTLVKKDRLEKLAAALVDYKIIKGDGSKWTGSGDLSMTANGAYSKFTGIEVDGKSVDSRYYEAKAGSTVVTLKESYLKSLKEGKHEFAVVYTDGAAAGSFTVKLAAQTPATGDGGMLAVSAAVCMMALVGLAAALMYKRRLVK